MNILFDLDGTLTDSAEGILNCVRPVFAYYHLPCPSEEELRSFVGPPLEAMFPKYGIPEDRVTEAVEVFRARYGPIGKYENRPYPGIREMLSELQHQGHHLFIATSKPEITALEVLRHFSLDAFFTAICGATMDSSRVTKSQVISCLLSQITEAESLVMVGDTPFDVAGAAAFGIPTVGVAWGYSSPDELLHAGAAAIADSPSHLLTILARFPKA